MPLNLIVAVEHLSLGAAPFMENLQPEYAGDEQAKAEVRTLEACCHRKSGYVEMPAWCIRRIW